MYFVSTCQVIPPHPGPASTESFNGTSSPSIGIVISLSGVVVGRLGTASSEMPARKFKDDVELVRDPSVSNMLISDGGKNKRAFASRPALQLALLDTRCKKVNLCFKVVEVRVDRLYNTDASSSFTSEQGMAAIIQVDILTYAFASNIQPLTTVRSETPLARMSYNNAFLIKSIAHQTKHGATLTTPAADHPYAHSIEPSALVLPTALPLTNELELEARAVSTAELERQSEELERKRQLAEALQEEHQQEERKQVVESQGSWVRLIAGNRKGKQKAEGRDEHVQTKAFDRPPNAYELYAAIDRKDIMYIMRVRDHAFPLLLQKNAGEFPIVYASRIGKSHQDIAILICGALSRYVNHLDESDFQKKETIGVLRQLRLNLKLAIDNSLLPESDPSLLSSYLQVLIMSEGDTWLHKAVHEVSLALRLSPYIMGTTLDSSSGPVHRADSMVRDFCTKELRNVQGGTFGVEAYIANAVMDLVIMATWSLIIEQIPEAEPLPTYSFARDQRTYSLFVEATEKYHLRIAQKTQKRLKALKNLLIEVCGETHVTIKERVSILRKQIDGEGADKAK